MRRSHNPIGTYAMMAGEDIAGVAYLLCFNPSKGGGGDSSVDVHVAVDLDYNALEQVRR